MIRRLLPSLLLALGLALPARAGEVTVFAAASTGTALAEIARDFEAATGHRAVVSLAGSSALARQILQGAPADVFLSANVAWMDALAEEGLIDPATRRDLLANRLVLVAGPGQTDDATDGDGAAVPVQMSPAFDLLGRLGEGRLAMALVEAVPAGLYGRLALESLGLWEAVRPRVAQADNVRAALALVALGAAPLGLVYATDVAAEPRVRVVATVPAESHPPIVYPVAAVTSPGVPPGTPSGADLEPATAAFLAYLGSAPARDAFAAQGFGWLAAD